MFENISVVAKQPNQSSDYGLSQEQLANVLGQQSQPISVEPIASVTPVVQTFKQEQHVSPITSATSIQDEPKEQSLQDSFSVRENVRNNGFLRLPETQAEAIELAKMLSNSFLLPDSIRSTPSVDHTADVFLLISMGCSLGMTAAQALRQIFVIKNKVGLYVSTKAGICYKHGTWTVSLENINGVPTAIAQGYRFDRSTETRKSEFSAHDARLKGKMQFVNGVWSGCSTWADKWPEMLRTRALGRLLDTLFPDVIGGFVSEDYEEDIEPQQTTESKETAAKTKALLKKVKAKDTAKELEPVVAQEPSLDNPF